MDQFHAPFPHHPPPPLPLPMCRRVGMGRNAPLSQYVHPSFCCGKKILTTQNDKFKIFDMKNDYTRTLPDTWKPMSRVFTALGDEHRQRMLLLFEKGERLNVGQIAEVSTLSRSTVSHHLKILREAEILRSEKIGKEVWYWINCPYLEEVMGNVVEYVRGIR